MHHQDINASAIFFVDIETIKALSLKSLDEVLFVISLVITVHPITVMNSLHALYMNSSEELLFSIGRYYKLHCIEVIFQFPFLLIVCIIGWFIKNSFKRYLNSKHLKTSKLLLSGWIKHIEKEYKIQFPKDMNQIIYKFYFENWPWQLVTRGSHSHSFFSVPFFSILRKFQFNFFSRFHTYVCWLKKIRLNQIRIVSKRAYFNWETFLGVEMPALCNNLSPDISRKRR